MSTTTKQSKEQPNVIAIKGPLLSKESYTVLISGYLKILNNNHTSNGRIIPNDVMLMICQYVITKRECLVKICSLGTNYVGKSSIIERYVNDIFTSPMMSTIGASFLIKYQEINECIRLKYQIWDNSGQEKYQSFSPMYYRNMQAAFLAFDITNKDSFNALKYWLDQVRPNVNNALIVVVGNKTDLENQRQVTRELGQQFADNNQCLFIETSAKTGDNINKLFEIMGKAIVERFNLEYIDANECNYNLLEKKENPKPNSSNYENCVLL